MTTPTTAPLSPRSVLDRPGAARAFRAVTRFDLDEPAVWRRWTALLEDGFGTAFQTPRFIRPLLVDLLPSLRWTPFVVEVHDETDRHVLSLALGFDASRRTRRIEFADLGLSDHNAPIWHRDLDLSGPRAEALRLSVLDALPPHDALVLAKMPMMVEGRANPLAAWPGSKPMNVVTMVYDPASRPVGELPAVKESARKRRRLTRDGGAIRRVEVVERALEILDFACDLRAEKARRDGRSGESLTAPTVRAFYRDVVASGVADGTVAVWEVVLDERIVAMVQGFAHRGRFNGTLMATADDDGLRSYSPGMIAVATVLEHHVANGGGLFDLGPGEHPYKTRFGGEPLPLFEYDRAATPRGLPALLDRRLRRLARAVLRRHPALRARVYRLLGKG